MKILLIIPYRGIGDLIFHIPLIRGIYKKYNSKINILTNKVNRAKNLLRNENTVDKIFYVNFQRENQIINSYKLLVKINSFNSDLCILTSPSKRLIIPLLFSNSKKKLFFKKKSIKDLSKYLIDQSNEILPEINFSKNYSLNISGSYINLENIFISIDSRHDQNDWDKNNFITLLRKITLIKKFKKIYVNFDPSKVRNFRSVINTFRANKKIHFTYSLNFNELLKIMNSCKYIIGNESGPICIGASMKKNVISIYYPKHTFKSSKTIYEKVRFFNTDVDNSNYIISKIINYLN